ncbi:Putative DNA repair helicase RadD [Anaerolineales bacterium]|nr:Putative DNA repair helicase RadD [Anaerolineales bacterium]
MTVLRRKEAFSRVVIDDQLRDAGWNLTDGTSVRYEYRLPDVTYADYVLCDRHGRALAVVEAKRSSTSARSGMINIYRDYSPGYFNLIITDECHRSIYGTWSGILKYFDGIQVDPTATPFPSDIETGNDEDRLFVRDTLRFFEVREPTFRYTLRQAIAAGYLLPYQIYKAKTVKTAAEAGFPVRKDELDWSAMAPRERMEFEGLFAGGDTIVVDPNALERRFTIPERNRAIVREFRQVLKNGYHDRTGRQRMPLIGKTIVFAATKRHAETLAQLFDDAFADEKPSPDVRYADYVVSGFGHEDTLDAATKIRRFKKEKFPQVLVSVNMLDTGFDAPEVVNLVMARFTRSVVLYRQMRGRGTRKAPGKPLFTLFDFVGVTDLHDENETFAEGGKVVERSHQTYQPRNLLTLDVDDHINHAAGIRRLRRQALEKTRRLISALFVEMFGDPASNPKGWPMVEVGDVIAGFEGGKNLLAVDVSSSAFKILKGSAVTSGYFKPWEAKPAPEGYAPPLSHFVRQGDLLFSCANTVDLVGATALVMEEPHNLLLPDKIWRFVWKEPSPVTPMYMLFLLQSAAMRQAMGKLATGTSDSMINISQGKLKCLPIPVPPLEIQKAFSNSAVEIASLITQQERSLAQAEALMHSLMDRYFGEAVFHDAKAPSPLPLSRRERGVKTTPLPEH